MIHCFADKDEEQVRGRSVLSPAMKFFRDLSDYLDYELVGAIVASSTPVWIETADPNGLSKQFRTEDEDTEDVHYQELAPGQIYYGNANERPHVITSNRPGTTFEAFVERVLRAVGASTGMPYEIVAKDFSKTNYSSARAALLEAWRIFSFYQKWLVDLYCRPVWEMVIEEAYLRGYIEIPMSTDDFYRHFPALTRARWIPPKRGHVDPTKEMTANIKGMENDILTLADIVAEDGGDWEAVLEQRAREREKKAGLEPEEKSPEPEQEDAHAE
jgi:lambda family phage portal protein